MEKLFVKFGKKMSRIGQKPIEIPAGVAVEVKPDEVKVIGPKGTLVQKFQPQIKVEIDQGQVKVKRQADDKLGRSLHGLTRSLIANMIEGVQQGFSKILEVVGTGFQAKLEGQKLILSLGFSHLVEREPPPGIKFEIEANNLVKISGIDKALVGQVAASIRAIRPPDPYKGKGIRYQDERVKLKPGKAGKVGAAGFGEEG